MKTIFAASAIAMMMLGSCGATAAEHEIRMLNKGEKGAMVFEPDLVRAAPADTIRFVPTDKTHNAETIRGNASRGGGCVQEQGQ